MSLHLALYQDTLVPERSLHWAAAPRGLYVREGVLTVNQDGVTIPLQADHCRLFEGAIAVSGEGECWTFEIGAGTLSAIPDERQAALVLAHELTLDPARAMVFRCDRVEFPAHAQTPRHGHKGAGIRRLVHGQLMAEVGAEWRRLGPGDAWFENGHDPVVGRNLAASSGFVRAMVLPERLLGRATFFAWDEAEAIKPRGTLRTEFFDSVVRM